VRGSGLKDGSFHIVTELAQGGSLRDALNSLPFTLKQRVKVALEAAQGLAHVHACGIVHRDVKTENILLATSHGAAKIADLGLACRLALEMAHGGTEEFMAPEVHMGEEFDCRADVFSLGVVLAELFTGGKVAGQNGFLCRGPATFFEVDQGELRAAMAGVPESLVALTLQCLAAEQHERLDAQGCAEWLEAFLADLEEESTEVVSEVLMSGELFVEEEEPEVAKNNSLATTWISAMPAPKHLFRSCSRLAFLVSLFVSEQDKTGELVRPVSLLEARTLQWVGGGRHNKTVAVDLGQKLKPPWWGDREREKSLESLQYYINSFYKPNHSFNISAYSL
jgi:serine/threonine protein kinase